jgi:hypothetical protein
MNYYTHSYTLILRIKNFLLEKTIKRDFIGSLLIIIIY